MKRESKSLNLYQFNKGFTSVDDFYLFFNYCNKYLPPKSKLLLHAHESLRGLYQEICLSGIVWKKETVR